LRYDVTGQAKGLNYRASADIRWQHADGRYVAEYTVRAFLVGSRSQRSEGRLTERGLQPERFTDKSRSERAAHFEPEQGRIRFSNNAPDAEWLPGTQDSAPSVSTTTKVWRQSSWGSAGRTSVRR
jgi:hypothetical protein